MQRILIAILLLLYPLSAASVTGGSELREDLFESEKELSAFSFSDTLTEEERAYYGNTELSLITASPSEPVYLYFGHSALSLKAPGHDAIAFDWGTFGFSPSFYRDFAFGLLYYTLSAGSEAGRLMSFEWEDRTTERLALELDPEAKKAAIAFLRENAKPENITYQYHYYLDNCATRIRDIYAHAKPGFREWAESVETGKSFRQWSTPYMHPSLFFAYFLNYLQGPSIDEPLNLYQACFLPDVLESAIAEYQGTEPETLYQTKTREAVPESYSLEARSLAIGALFCAAILLTYPRRRWISRVGNILSAIIYIAMGVMSSLLVFMMLFTNHDVTYFNINPLIISPGVFILGALHIASAAKGERKRAIDTVSIALLSIAALALAFQLLTPFRQANASYYITAAMLYIPDSLKVLSSFQKRRR